MRSKAIWGWPLHRLWAVVFSALWFFLGLLIYDASPAVATRDVWLTYSFGFIVFSIGMTALEQVVNPVEDEGGTGGESPADGGAGSR